MEHYNKLTPAEAERLVCLIEECGEVIQAASKILRHGYNSYDPTNPNHGGNRSDLYRELVDVIGNINLMLDKGDFSGPIYLDATMKKFRYMHHQDEAI